MQFGIGYLGVAYGLVFGGIAGYLALLGRRQRVIDQRLNEMQRPEADH